MTLQSQSIRELDFERSAANPSDWMILQDFETGQTYRIRRSDFLAGTQTSFLWSAATTYAANAIVEWGGTFWRSLQAGNVNRVPGEGAWWTEVEQADESAVKLFEANKIYKSDIVVVLHNNQLYRLTNATRPYQAATFVTADWQVITPAWSPATGAVLTGPNTITMGSNPIVFTGNRVSFTPNLSTAGVNVGEFAGTPLSLLTGDIWVLNDGSANRFMGRIMGDTRAFLTMQVGDLNNSLSRIPFVVNINTARMNTSEDLKFDGFTLILGGGTATPSTILDLKSTTRAFALPRMTTAQRDAIPNPSAGMLIFNISTAVCNFHNGTVWGAI